MEGGEIENSDGERDQINWCRDKTEKTVCRDWEKRSEKDRKSESTQNGGRGKERGRKFFQSRKSSTEPQRLNPQEKKRSNHLTLLCFSLPLFPSLCVSLCVPLFACLSLSLWCMTPRSFLPHHCFSQSHFLSPSFCPPLVPLTNFHLFLLRPYLPSLSLCFLFAFIFTHSCWIVPPFITRYSSSLFQVFILTTNY